jgi:DNA-binding CsgD family transcriptional regulator
MRKVMIETVKSVAAVRGGDSETALRSIKEVFETVPPPAWGVVAGLPLSVAVRASTELGDAHSARAYLTVPVPPGMLDTPFAVPYLQALGRYQQAMDHPESATMYSRWCVELMKRWGVDTAAVAAALAEFDRSRPLRPALEEKAGAGRQGLSGTNTAAQARQAATGEDLSEWGAGGEPAGLAAPDVEDGAKLTVAERRVVALAAAGNTNREIAERLFITVSTVEQHLTKVYRKLNVRSRSGLRRYRR